MARKSSNNNDNNDEILMKGLSNLNSSLNKVSEDIGKVAKDTKKLNTETTGLKANVKDIDSQVKKAATEKELKEVNKNLKDLKSSIDSLKGSITAAGSSASRGASAQAANGASPQASGQASPGTSLIPVGGSKIMSTVPTPSKASAAPAKGPGTAIMAVAGGSPAAVAQNNNVVNAVKGVGDKVTGFFSGRAFWGKMLGTIVDGIIGSKLLSNTIGDVIKLGVLLLSNFMRNFFGKQIGGITYILGTIATAISGLAGGIGIFKGLGAIRKALKLKHGLKFAGKAGLAAATRFPRHLLRAGKAISTGVTAKALSAIKELPKTGAKVIKGAASAIKAPIKTLSKLGGKSLLKGGMKVAGKKIPGVGVLLGAGLAAGRAMNGDWLGAGGELASGIAGSLPGAGTAASFGIDAWLMKRDYDRAQGKKVLGDSGKGSPSTTVGDAGKVAGKALVSSGNVSRAGGGALLKAMGKIVMNTTLIGTILQGIWNLFNSGPFSSVGNFIKGIVEAVKNAFTGGGSTGGSPSGNGSSSVLKPVTFREGTYTAPSTLGSNIVNMKDLGLSGTIARDNSIPRTLKQNAYNIQQLDYILNKEMGYNIVYTSNMGGKHAGGARSHSSGNKTDLQLFKNGKPARLTSAELERLRKLGYWGEGTGALGWEANASQLYGGHYDFHIGKEVVTDIGAKQAISSISAIPTAKQKAVVELKKEGYTEKEATSMVESPNEKQLKELQKSQTKQEKKFPQVSTGTSLDTTNEDVRLGKLVGNIGLNISHLSRYGM